MPAMTVGIELELVGIPGLTTAGAARYCTISTRSE